MIAFACILAATGPLAAWWLWRRGAAITRAVVGLLALAYLLGVWAVLIEPQTLSVREVAVESPAWRGAPVRIGVLSDVHVGPDHMPPDRVRRIVTRLNRERPDVIVFLGDYVGGHAPAAQRSEPDRAEVMKGVAALGEARAPLGRYAVLGNHDWWFGGLLVEAALTRAGAPVLENRAVRIDRPGGSFWIAGLADMESARASPSAAAALREIPDGEPAIVLTHWPDTFPGIPDRIALTLAGHSHCGQVNLPFVGRPVLPSPGSARWPCGVYREGERQLYVTGGVGTSILPVRFRAPPEIVIVTLSAAP
ncbi:metallophosphoesterase [Phenylobacterium sp. SCN 70-31]|uniref:metallophosphoesterase n=1 Tax=Phenylobacterium sp. SCN 70-31 TaxID=1660129 RepID=UPI000AB5A20F|nr:metallophosphoesterase [Phenylobacterium sp. SCN 70-31]